jgi:hypothetical protein
MLTCEDDCDDWFEAGSSLEPDLPLLAQDAEPLDVPAESGMGQANDTDSHRASDIRNRERRLPSLLGSGAE